jgi:hypothetical protein
MWLAGANNKFRAVWCGLNASSPGAELGWSSSILGIGGREAAREEGTKADGTQESIKLSERNGGLNIADQLTGVKLAVKIYFIQFFVHRGRFVLRSVGFEQREFHRRLLHREDCDGAVGGLGLVVGGAVGDDDVGFAAGLQVCHGDAGPAGLDLAGGKLKGAVL